MAPTFTGRGLERIVKEGPLAPYKTIQEKGIAAEFKRELQLIPGMEYLLGGPEKSGSKPKEQPKQLGLEGLLPQMPQDGPPLPRILGIKWPGKK